MTSAMQNESRTAARRSVASAVVALACSVVLNAVCASAAHAVEPRNGTSSASLSVSVSVVRKCTLATPALVSVGDESAATVVGGEVALACSQGDAAAVEVGPPSAQSALYAQLARGVGAGASGSADGASDPLVVTVLF